MHAPWLLVLGGACASIVFGCQGRPVADLSEAQLSRVVDERRPTLESCYNAALEKTAYKNEVRMAAIIHVAPDGSVASVEVEGTGLPGMPACVHDAIKTWRFPTATDATHTRLPIVFSPQVVQRPPPAAL
jgi:hypothetical protein